MDEIEYKLNTNNSVLIVNAVDKLISTIKYKFKPVERQRFVNENEELKFLREKCSSKDPRVSLTACQGLLALVELGVLEIAHTMSTVVTLLPSAHNYSAIISTMAGLLILDLKGRLVPGQQYKCQFTLRSPQHPFITVLEKNKGAEDDVLTQMHALCTHPDYIVSSNSLELLRPVFLWLTCHPSRSSTIRPWQLLLSLPQTTAQSSLLLACLSCQQICNPNLLDRSFAAYSAVTEAAIYQQQTDLVLALLPMLARISNELTKHGRDPRGCYSLLERGFALEAPGLRSAAGLTLMLLADNLPLTSALYLHELFNLCLNILSKFECSSLSLCVLSALSLQWLQLPSYLTAAALKVCSKILDIYQDSYKDDTRLHTPNLKSNKTFVSLLHTDSHLAITFKLVQSWERLRDNPDKLNKWLDVLECMDGGVKLELLPFLLGIVMEKRQEKWFEDVVVRVLKMAVGVVNYKKELSVMLLPILVYKIANDKSPIIKWECLKALPLMAKTKENVPSIVSVLNKLKSNKGVPSSFLVALYTTLAETQVRCFPYLQELLVEGPVRADELKWELDIAKATAVDRICQIRASSHGLELVSVISSLLNRSGDRSGAVATCTCLRSLAALWRGGALAPHSTWAALQHKLAGDTRPMVQIYICKLLSEVPGLRNASPEYDKLISEAVRKLWGLLCDSNHPAVAEAACDALAGFKVEDYKLKDIPDVYRRTVKLPASFCKTPADAARRPEDVLDYVPCEIWPEVFKYTNQDALLGVQRLASKLIEREVKSYRSGVYQHDARQEPTSVGHLPNTSVVRGLMECFRRQATTPSYDFPECALLSILSTLSSEYPKPLPPLDLSFLPELFHRSTHWRSGCVTLAARQATVSLSGRRILENYLQGITAGTAEESDVLLIFEILPVLSRGIPPNTLRPPLEKCLTDSYNCIANVKRRESEKEIEYLFIKQLDLIRVCLESEKIHDANRTLLSQILENHFALLNDDNVAWPAYVQAARVLSSKYLERMTSPSSWWEVSGQLLRKSASLRCAVAAMGDCDTSLNWLNEIIDAQATQLTEQEYSLRCIFPALRAAPPDSKFTKQWFLQLMGRTQVAFNETEDISAKLYLCDVFMLCVIVFSGLWGVEPDPEELVASRPARHALLPPAAAALVGRKDWEDCALQLLEWLSHSRAAVPGAAPSCQRALLAARHNSHFATHNIWTKLESHFGCDIIDE